MLVNGSASDGAKRAIQCATQLYSFEADAELATPSSGRGCSSGGPGRGRCNCMCGCRSGANLAPSAAHAHGHRLWPSLLGRTRATPARTITSASLAAHRPGTEAAQARRVKKAAVKPTTVTTELSQQTRCGGAVGQPIDTPFVMQTIAVKTRVFINLFDEQFGVSLVPSLEGLEGCLMARSALRDAVVVGGKVLGEGAFELCS